MIELPPKFKQAIGNGQRTSLYPILRIYKGVTIDTDPQNHDFAGNAEGILNLSIKETSLDGESYLPLLLNSPSLKSSADIVNNKYTTSSISLTISNAPYNGKKFSDNVIDYLKSVCQVFYTSNGIDSIDDCLLIYTGTIRRFSQTFDSLKLELEDFTQQVLSAKVPNTLIPDNPIEYSENITGKPYPMIYGNINHSPLIYNKLGRLEIDKPAQKVKGYWSFGTTIDYQNEAIDESHPFRVHDFLRDNAYLSVYDQSHLYIFQHGVAGWGSRRYDEIHPDLEFYTFTDAEIDDEGNAISAHIKINDDAYVYPEYRPIGEEEELEGVGDRGIPARVYRPIQKASFFTYNEYDRTHFDQQFHNGNWYQNDLILHNTVNKFIGYSNHSGLADNVVQTVSWESYFDAPANILYNQDADIYESSVMQQHYYDDFDPDINPGGPIKWWWQPTYCNEITDQQPQVKRWGYIDTNHRDAGKVAEFDVSWIQNALPTSGIHMYAVNAFEAGGCFVRLYLNEGIGSYPCVTKIFYDVDYITPKLDGNTNYRDFNVYPSHFWVNRELVKRSQTGTNDIDGTIPNGGDGLINNDKIKWEWNRDDDEDGIQDEDWVTWGRVPNVQHSFGKTEDENFIQGGVHTIDAEAKRVETDFASQFTGDFAYHNILKDFNQTTQYDSVQWGSPYITKMGQTFQYEDSAWTMANLKNVYVIQDVLIDDLQNEDFFGNVAGRVDDIGEQIVRIEDIMVDILDNELGFQQAVSLNPANSDWKFDFVLNEQKEVKQLFEGLFKSSTSIPAYDNFGQFKLIPIYQRGDIPYSKVKAIDVIKYVFTLSKLDEVYNQVNVKYFKDYASGEFITETGYALRDSDGNTYETYDILTSTNYQDNPELWYDIGYYGSTDALGKLEVESEYIRDEDTAFKLQKRLVNWYINQHLMVKIDLPVSYLNLEAGDYIRFDELLGGVKVFGYDYTTQGIKNGQIIFPIFFITSINKSIEKISVEAIQMHRGEYGFDDTITDEDEEDGGVFSDSGGNNGELNFDIGDPFDNPAYDDDTINQEEPDYSYFNLFMSDNTVINNGQVTGSITTSYQYEWDYKIFATKIESDDGSPIFYEDENGDEQPLETGTFTEEDDINLEFLFHIYKSVSNMADNYNGSVSINKKYSIFPHNCNIEATLKVYSLACTGPDCDDYIQYGSFSQSGEWAEGDYPFGDVNADYIVNILDVVRLATIVTDTAENVTPEELIRADINGDGIVNILDIVQLVQIIFEG